MKRAISLLCVAGLISTAAADSKKVMVLKAEGRADAKLRAKIDSALVKLAKTGSDQITPGDVTLSDAALMVGCEAEQASCKDEVIATLAVDEVVATTVTPKPGGFEVAVKRFGKGGAQHDASAFVTHDSPDKLDALSPLFVAPVAATVDPVKPPKEPIKEPIKDPAKDPIRDPIREPIKEPPPPVVATAPDQQLIEQPPQPEGRSSRKLQLAGMIGGGVAMAMGFGFWSKASDIERDIANAPSRTKNDILHIQDLEDEGDKYAGAGNLFFLGGAVILGVSTFFYIRKGRRASSTALAPAVFDHGMGIALTIGGNP